MHDQLQILLVDDDAEDRRSIELALRSHSPQADIQEALTYSEAAEALDARQFDCVLLDYHRPGGNGMTFLAGLREAGNNTPVIMLTDEGDEKAAIETLRAGATDYLPKGELTPSLLDHCLRGAIRYQQSQTQVRHAHEALELRDRAIAAASNGILIADPHQPDCPIIYCNPAFTTITGYAPEEVLGRNCRFLQGPDTDPEHVRQVAECIQQQQECQIVLKNYRKDGTLFWNALTISSVRDQDGKIMHFIGIQTDITERRMAEDALKANVKRQHALLQDMFASVTEGKLILCASHDDLPDPLKRFAEPVSLSASGGIRELRQHTLGACLEAGIPDARRYDLETAVGEAAMNAVVHTGAGTGYVFSHHRGIVQVRIEDSGKGIAVENLPNATLKRGYNSAGTMGHGFKMILKTVDRVFLLTGSTGTTVVIEQDRLAPLPSW